MKNMKVQTQSAIRVIRGNKLFCRAVASVSAMTFLLISAAPAFAGSTSVLGGNAELTGMTRATLDSNSANAAAFSSTSASAVLDWTKFNIGSGQSMSFNGAGTTFFNLVDGAAGKSQIDGIINGSGNVWVINPAGIAFGASASVNVGCLFAAAAGTVENAAELRAGTAMTPTFSAFSGELDATKGAFVADQIALMGGKVSVGGEADFTGAFKVDVGAGDRLIVDDVGGGMVSIDMSQFAETAKDVLDISGLDAGDALVDVVANGNVKATGDIQAGRLQVMAANDVNFAANVTTSMGEVGVASLNKGDITLSGEVSANGSVGILANDGSVRIEDTASIMSQDGDSGIDIAAGLDVVAGGSVMIDGHVQSHGYIDVMARDSISVGKGAAVKTDGEDGLVYLQAGKATYDNGELVGVTGGDIVVGEDAVVAADGTWGAVNLHAVNGTVEVKGELVADNEGIVDVSTGYAAKGGVRGPEEAPVVLMNGGDVIVGASSKVSAQEVWITSNGGKVEVQGRILGTGCVSLAGDGVTSSGTIDVRQGTLEVYGNRGDINLYDKASGVVYAGDIILVAEGNVLADNPNNRIGKVTEAEAGPGKVLRINLGGGGDDPETVEIGNIVSDTAYLRSEKGTIKVVGDITAPDQVVLETEEGDIIVMEGCTVTATGSGAIVRLKAGRNVVSEGNLVADGGVELSAKNDITVNNADGITLNGAVSENGSVSVSTKNGDIVIAPDARVTANGEGGCVTLKAGTLASGEGSVLVGENATLQAQDTVLAIAGYGKLKASGALEGGEVPVLKNAMRAANFLLANSASSFVEIGDRVTVIAGRLISLEGKVSVVSSGTINAANAKLEVVAHEGDIDLYAPTEDHAGAGKVIAGQADFVVNGTGDINVNNGDNAIDALGRVKADAQADIEINLGNDNGGAVKTITAADLVDHPDYRHAVIEDGTILIVGDITCPDMVCFRSNSGDVIVMEGATVKVVDQGEGEGAYLMVSAGRSARIDGTLDSDGTVGVTSYGTGDRVGITVGGNGLVKAGDGYSTAAFTANNFVRIDGTVDSKSSVNVDAAGDVTIGGSVSAAEWASLGYAYTLENIIEGRYPIGGKISVDGSVEAGGIELFAMGDVNVGEGAALSAKKYEMDVNSALGSVALMGKSVEAPLVDVQAQDDITMGNVKATRCTTWYGDVDGDGFDDNVSLYACAINGKMTVLPDATVETSDVNGGIYLLSGGGFEVGENAVVKADAGANGNLFVTSEGAGSTMKIDGCLQASRETLVMNNGGNVEIGKNGRVDGGQAATVFNVGAGDVSVDGTIASDDFAAVTARGGAVRVGGAVNGAGAAMVEACGDIAVNGVVRSDGMAEGMAVLQTAGSGNVVLGRDAEVKGALGAVIKTESGDLIQRSAPVVDASKKGYAQSESLRPAIAAKNVILDVKGDVIGDNGGSVTVDGTIAGIVSGNAKIAIGNGHDLVGGTKQDAAKVVEGGGGLFSVDLSALGENSAMLIGGNLSLYTAGGIGSYTTFKAGGDASISAARFGDTSYLQAGGRLTINNVGHPSHPQIAYFESVNGVEPKINNLPNDTVIFVDGRLAGGNLNILNKFGADEAFMVETPELKSKQGIFGNPPFLHSDLDVANPMEVCAIDYLIQEIPRLTLSSDFPAEVDRNVEAVGLSQKDVYWFGQNGAGEEPGSGVEPDENTVEKDEEAEPLAEKTVAVLR